MADRKKIATREGYGAALLELGAEDERVVALDADLAGATRTGVFQKAYPERHFNCGIAEANEMCVAAGLATMGLIPFASSFAMFATGRAYEQIRNSIGYPHLNVKVAASHGGISVGEDGASHQCFEDVALMRMIPGMVVLVPADEVEARKAVRAAYEHEGPVYLRFCRAATEVFHREDYEFQIGKGEVLQDGRDLAILADGIMVPEAIHAGEALLAEGIHARVINMATVKPLDEEVTLSAAKECGRIITVEEASVIGGLGEAVCSYLSETCPVPVKRIGIDDVFGYSGPAEGLLKAFGLSAEHIAAVAREMVR